MAIANKYERMIHIYNWYRTARLNVLYYERTLRIWVCLVRSHDVLIALAGVGSPIAFWQHAKAPLLQQGWFYLTLVASLLGLLKPILRWENQLKLYSELHTHYCDLSMDLKYLIEDITASNNLTELANRRFEHFRLKFRELGNKEPLPSSRRIKAMEAKVLAEMNINDCWFPTEGEEDHG